MNLSPVGRNRIPSTGRTNMSSHLSSPDSSVGLNISTERREQLNNPLEVFRPFSPENRIAEADAHIKRPPILPKSRYPTVPPDSPPRKTKPLSCPDDWKERLMRPQFFETVDQRTLVDEKAKTDVCRAFVERNRNRLWKFNLKYLNMTPREVCNDIVDNPGFLGTMKLYFSKERVLNLNSSEKFVASVKDDHLESLGEIHDLHLTSTTTTRTAREEKLKKLLEPALREHDGKYCRGYNHAPEYGNFSKYSGILLANQGATLKR